LARGAQILHLIWNDCIVYFESPEGQISLLTGPVAGCITGVGAGVIQFKAEDSLHVSEPDRFPPGILAFVREVRRKGLSAVLTEIKAEDSLKMKKPAPVSSTTYPAAGVTADSHV
jgi:hypothetical protein